MMVIILWGFWMCVPLVPPKYGNQNLSFGGVTEKSKASQCPKDLLPALTAEQVEADWRRQDELRMVKADPKGPSHLLPGWLVRPEEDAAGAVDGQKTGKWGFHTAWEKDPWWQVDLGESVRLGKILLWNRCDACSERNSHILISISQDAKDWKKIYQHHGTVFYGQTDGKPLVVAGQGIQARYVRVHLEGENYLHLDEVEVFAEGADKNIALGKPATQSSTSQWSSRHALGPGQPAVPYPMELVMERGRLLADRLVQMGAAIQEHREALERAASEWARLPADAPDELRRRIYFQARWAVRRMALANPLLNFDQILFVKRIPPAFPHMSDQYYGWWSRGGGGIYILEGFRQEPVQAQTIQLPAGEPTAFPAAGRRDPIVGPRLRCLTEGWPVGSFIRPELSYDGTKVLFAYARYYPHVHTIPDKVNKDNLPEDAFYHLYEMRLDGGGVRRLTRGKYDHFDGRYLPDGRIVFLSTRKGQAVQTPSSKVQSSEDASARPDSYVRCGGDNARPVPVYTLHLMDSDGGNLRPISAFENFEWYPAVAWDGRILYARWDYIDRPNGDFLSLWSTNPDGTNPQLVYGNFTHRPQCVFQARPIPGSTKLIFTASAHHSNVGGSLVILDRRLGTEGQGPIRRITPEVVFPETEGWPQHYYTDPWPLSEEFFLVAWSDRPLPPCAYPYVADERNPAAPTGIYLLDVFGNMELLYRDPTIGSWDPIPVQARPKPPMIAHQTAAAKPPQLEHLEIGYFLLQDVYRGLGSVAQGSIRRLRIVAVVPKLQPHMNQPNLGISSQDPGKFVLGTVPVEPDGSAYFQVPAGVPVFFQALDAEGYAVQTMRTLTYVQPGTTLSCIGCHENRDTAPAVGSLPMAARRAPSRVRPGPEGSWPLRYDRLVQPVLDKYCVRCHRPDGPDPKAARYDLTPAKSYENLLNYADRDLHKLAFERDRSVVGQMPARQSKLLRRILGNNAAFRSDPDALERMQTWMDTYAHRQGHFSDQQEAEILQLRQQWQALLEER
ncbi:MAG: discoidin domain-containing protein [Thermoguttaceae bacterium]|nr:discoidin domain-containing protein [Thermoguttaceae bacterium]MDW8037777.1 discoidin domain-containing protein [Thermoguttaceae bacterium]